MLVLTSLLFCLLAVVVAVWFTMPSFKPVHAKDPKGVGLFSRLAERPSLFARWKYAKPSDRGKKDEERQVSSFKGKTGFVVRGESGSGFGFDDGDYVLAEKYDGKSKIPPNEKVIIRIESGYGRSLRQVKFHDTKTGLVTFKGTKDEDSASVSDVLYRGARVVV